jgi:GGDEF domain-containing protein
MTNKSPTKDPFAIGGENHYSESRRVPALSWFYCLWVALAGLSALLGHSHINSGAALLLVGGIVSTNFFFLSIRRTEKATAGLAALLANYQTIMGIAWTSAYFYFSTGSGDLVLGMYMTVLMFGIFYLSLRTTLNLSIGALLSYLLVVGIKIVSLPMAVEPLEEGLRFVLLLALTIWIYMFARRLRDLRFELLYRNEELQAVVERVTRIAEEDHLTKSYNRRYIMDVLNRERSRADRSGHKFTVLLFDLDHFKSINDRYGHLVGDQILSDFARYVKGELRGMDAINSTKHKADSDNSVNQKRSFGRYGGEEFITVLPGTGIAGGELCAERIRKVIASKKFRDRYAITVSVGVAEYQLGENVPQLITRADEALYKAKRDGRNLVRCSNAIAQPEVEQDKTVPNLRILK